MRAGERSYSITETGRRKERLKQHRRDRQAEARWKCKLTHCRRGEERRESKEEGNPTNCWRKGSDRIQERRWSDTLLGRRGPEKCTRASALTFCRKFWHVLIKQVLFWREQMWQAKNYATNCLPQGLTFTDRYLHYTENSCMVHVCELHTQHETWNKNLQEFCT